MHIRHIHIFNSKRIEITVHKSSCEIELILRKVNCNSTKLIPLIKYRSKPANNLYNVQDDRRKETSLPFIFLVVPSISFAYNPFVDKTLLPLSTSSRLVDESPRLRSRGVMNENMYSLSWRPGESSARTLRSSAFVNEPIHTHTNIVFNDVRNVEWHVLNDVLPRERELLLSLRGRGGGWMSCNDRRGRSKFIILSLSLSLLRINRGAVFFDERVRLTRDHIA